MASDDELTIMPMKLTSEKQIGIEISCGHKAADGWWARDAKSGAFLQSMGQTWDSSKRPEPPGRGKNVRSYSGHVTNTRHEAWDHRPSQVWALYFRWSTYNWAYATGLYNAPDKESDASDGSNNSLQGKEMAASTGISTGEKIGRLEV